MLSSTPTTTVTGDLQRPHAGGSSFSAKLATIPPGVPFLPALAHRLLNGALPFLPHIPSVAHDPFALSAITLLLPTRRAARGLARALADAACGSPVITPRLGVLGDLSQESDLAFDLPVEIVESAPPRVLPVLDRLLVLARLVQAWQRQGRAARAGSRAAISVRETLALTDDLITFMDQVNVEGADWARLAGLVPEDLAMHWQEGLSFLQIATRAWPSILDDLDQADPTQHRERLIRRSAERLAATCPESVIIAAGTFGSTLATVDLLATIARLPRGLVILPGIDTTSSHDAWQAVGACDGSDPAAAQAHPQHAAKRLLVRIAGPEAMALRKDILVLETPSPALALRERLVAEALNAAPSTADWRQWLEGLTEQQLQESVAGVSMITCHNQREEALTVALLLRAALEDPTCRVAAVTPDRELARRIAVELRRWQIIADDSAGQPLSRTESGILAQLVLAFAVRPPDGHALLALLKHPLCTLGRERALVLSSARVLERFALRVSPLAGGAHRVAPRLKDVLHDAQTSDDRKAEISAALALYDDLTRAVSWFTEAAHQGERFPVGELAQRLAEALEAVRRLPAGEQASAPTPAPTPDEAALAALVEELVLACESAVRITVRDLPDLLAWLCGKRLVTRPLTTSHRVSIWGSLEARLQPVDQVVLAGLNEGVWPGTSDPGPFLSRPMRSELGLSAPERLVGLSAHDFQQLMGVKQITLTRSERVGTSPTVASRFWQRLQALLGEAAIAGMRQRGASVLALARGLDRRPGPAMARARPNPIVPVELRPAKLSVTEIETLIRDPYAIYARHILRLRPLAPIAGEPGTIERGILYHDILRRFFRTRPDDLSNAEQELLAIARDAFAALAHVPDVQAVWWLRFERIAHSLLAWERQHGSGARWAEVEGQIEAGGPGTSFRLTARADRIDVAQNGQARILDYKTGAPPTARQVAALLVPQLPLEAAILKQGGFAGIGPLDATQLVYLRLSGDQPPVLATPVPGRNASVADLSARALDQLAALTRKYADPQTGYRSRERPMRIRFPGDYDHLARVAEWSLDAGPASGADE